jgi:hypothetical protein
MRQRSRDFINHDKYLEYFKYCTLLLLMNLCSRIAGSTNEVKVSRSMSLTPVISDASRIQSSTIFDTILAASKVNLQESLLSEAGDSRSFATRTR